MLQHSGDDTILIFELFEKLRGQAAFAGGKFLTNLGNHEMMNVRGDWRCVLTRHSPIFTNDPDSCSQLRRRVRDCDLRQRDGALRADYSRLDRTSYA